GPTSRRPSKRGAVSSQYVYGVFPDGFPKITRSRDPAAKLRELAAEGAPLAADRARFTPLSSDASPIHARPRRLLQATLAMPRGFRRNARANRRPRQETRANSFHPHHERRNPPPAPDSCLRRPASRRAPQIRQFPYPNRLL